MVAYHCNSNAILVAPFKTRKDKHILEAYKSIMTCLCRNGMSVNLQILDNEASSKFKHLITEDSGITYQLVPPDIHRHNAAERAIRTFRVRFLSILAGIAPDFLRFLWDHLLSQTEMTLNFLRKSTLNPTKSEWEFFNAPFDYAATPFGPLGRRIIIHKKIACTTHGASMENMVGASGVP